MTETLALLGRWMAHHGITHDAEAARQLGITRAAISNWRCRNSQADAGTIVRMCGDLGEDLAACLKRIAAEQGHPAGTRYTGRKRTQAGTVWIIPRSAEHH